MGIQHPVDHDRTELEHTFKAFGFLFYDYEPEFFYWEMLAFTRKFLVLVISIWFPPATSMNTRTFALGLLVCCSLALTARFRPYLQSQADTLDIVTQLVSLVSIMLAQYAYATTDAFSAEEKYGKAMATVMFVVSNTTLLVVHASLVAVPLWHAARRLQQRCQQMSAGCTSARDKLHERFAADAEERSSDD